VKVAIALGGIIAMLAAGVALGAGNSPEGDSDTAPKCKGRVPTIVGTPGDDHYEGRQTPDVIVGLGGADEIRGRKGDDVICGGPGDDSIAGGKGDDVLLGEGGRDGLKGGPGQDTLRGGPDPGKEIQ
jgi:uncharacterized protein